MSTVVTPESLHQEYRDGLANTVLKSLFAVSILIGLVLSLVGELPKTPWQIGRLGLLLTTLPIVLWLLVDSYPRLAPALTALFYGLVAIHVFTVFDSPPILALLAIPTALVALLFNTVWGAVSTGLATALILVLTTWPPEDGGATLCMSIVALWLLQAIAWAAHRHGWESISWLWNGYSRAESLLQKARDQRMHLRQAQQALIDANLDLERLTERLALMSQLAEEARQSKEQFLTKVSHELRTPLNMILGFCEVITEAPRVYRHEMPPALLADLSVIQRNSQHLSSLVDDLLDLSKAEAGRMALNREWVSMSEIVEAAAVAVSPLLQSKQLSLSIDSPSGLPRIFCDRVRIRQVLLNLMINAGRFTEKGGIDVSLRQEGNKIICSVRDTGSGIAPEDQTHIFEPFRQVGPDSSDRGKGSGLGLSISKQFVELHHGRMWVNSELGRGSTFSLSLPLITETTVEPLSGIARWFSPYNSYDEKRHPGKALRAKTKPRFVTVDHNGALERLLSHYRIDAELATAASVAQAVAEISRVPAQALILNHPLATQLVDQIPELAHLPYQTPAVVCWLPGREEIAHRLGVADYLTKPVSWKTLLRAIDALGHPVSTILVVDDDAEAVQLLARMLAATERGYRVLRSTRARQAIELLKAHQPDLTLLDLVMPGMDGYELLRAKAQDPEIASTPVIAISGLLPHGELIQGTSFTIIQRGGIGMDDMLAYISTLTVPERASDK